MIEEFVTRSSRWRIDRDALRVLYVEQTAERHPSMAGPMHINQETGNPRCWDLAVKDDDGWAPIVELVELRLGGAVRWRWPAPHPFPNFAHPMVTALYAIP